MNMIAVGQIFLNKIDNAGIGFISPLFIQKQERIEIQLVSAIIFQYIQVFDPIALCIYFLFQSTIIIIDILKFISSHVKSIHVR